MAKEYFFIGQKCMVHNWITSMKCPLPICLKAMYLDEQERMYYDLQQKFWLDQISYVAEFIKKAREESIKEAKLSTAKNLIKLGFDDATFIQVWV